MPESTWGTPLRDVLTGADFELELGALNTKLLGLLHSSGQIYKRPYSDIIERIGEPISENRLETWKKLFQDLGLVWVDEGTLQVTRFGQVFAEAGANLSNQIDAERLRIAQAAATVLGKQQLRNPTTRNRDYPDDCDILPYRVIWQTMKRLGSLHWEEFHRVILRVMRTEDLEDALSKIERARQNSDYDPQNQTAVEKYLGKPVYDDGDQAARRMTPWFSAAGFGGLLIDREPTNGTRSLTQLGNEVISHELHKPIQWRDFGDDIRGWFDYLTADVSQPRNENLGSGERLTSQLEPDDPILKEVEKLIFEDEAGGVLFVGAPGTGKSWYARQLAIKLTDGQSDLIREVQFHPSYQYEDFVEGYVPKGEEGFELVDRHLLQMVHKAQGHSEPTVLVIDEFSRTDPARVLGETLTYMEGSLRGVQFYLPSGRLAEIPKNLVFLATMNPDDRSVDEMDDAMERRWAKIHLRPDAAVLRKFLEGNGYPAQLFGPTLKFFNALQDHISVGHAFFRRVKDEESLTRVWSTQIHHLAQKKFRFDSEELAAVQGIWETCVAEITEQKTSEAAGNDDA